MLITVDLKMNNSIQDFSPPNQENAHFWRENLVFKLLCLTKMQNDSL